MQITSAGRASGESGRQGVGREGSKLIVPGVPAGLLEKVGDGVGSSLKLTIVSSFND